jgi:hypothetical protein
MIQIVMMIAVSKRSGKLIVLRQYLKGREKVGAKCNKNHCYTNGELLSLLHYNQNWRPYRVSVSSDHCSSRDLSRLAP